MLTGQVVNALTTAGIPGAMVAGDGKSATTDRSGRYTLTGVPLGSVTLNVSADGYISGSKSLMLVADQSADIALLPQRDAAWLSGTATDGTSHAVLPNVTVAIIDGNNAGKSAVTDASGAYRMVGLRTGTATLVVSAAGYPTMKQQLELLNIEETANFAMPLNQASSTFGLRYDNISAVHQFITGSPVPTQDAASVYCCWPPPMLNSGTFVFKLSDFPLNILPSGGTSNVVSPSEMIYVAFSVSGLGPLSMQWHRAIGRDTIIETSTSSSDTDRFTSWAGHFDSQITQPGTYYVVVITPWGNARLDFLVTD